MNSLFRSCYRFLNTHSVSKPLSSCTLIFTNSSFKAVKFGLNIRCYSSAKKGIGKARKLKPSVMEGKSKDEFFVVRKGDLVGIYGSLSDCQAQVGSSGRGTFRSSGEFHYNVHSPSPTLVVTPYNLDLISVATALCQKGVGAHLEALVNATVEFITQESRLLKPHVMKGKRKESKDEFFVMRKGDFVGIYSSLSDCQAQVGSSICDPPVSVYKGSLMPEKTEDYLLSCGLKNALYSIRAADLKDDLFGTLVPCPFQLPSCTQSDIDVSKKRSYEMLGAETMDTGLSTSISIDPMRKHVKQSCIIEFDGASKGNPGQAGAGAVLRADDGSVICRLREGLGTATNNVAEYRAMILGLKYALEKGFKSIRVVGDSKLVCMQMSGQWKVKDQNISIWYQQAKKLKDKFLSFEISHVLRGLNSDADAQANLGVALADGEVQEEFA